MTQYLMRKEKDSKNLKNVIKNYEPLWFNVRPFSLGNAKTKVAEDLRGKKFNFLFLNGLKFSSDRDLIYLPLNDYKYGFKMEYRNEEGLFEPPEGRRIYPFELYPDDPSMPEVYQSVLRNVIDDLLIEISFKGKVKLEYDDKKEKYSKLVINYWKVLK